MSVSISRCGWVKLYVGQVGEAVQCFLRAIRVQSPHPYTFNAPVGMAAARLMEGKPEEAKRWARQALQRNAMFAAAHRVLIFALVEQSSRGGGAGSTSKNADCLVRIYVVPFRRLAPFSDRAFNERFARVSACCWSTELTRAERLRRRPGETYPPRWCSASSGSLTRVTTLARPFKSANARPARRPVRRSGVELLDVIGAVRLECGEPPAETGELIRRQLGNSFGDFFDLHVAQYIMLRLD